jgi:enolase-phosphatase E1
VKLPESGQIEAVLLDIEGTTTPLAFVYDVLFPYAARQLNAFIRRHFRDSEVRRFLESLRQQRALDASLGLAPPAWNDNSENAEITSIAEYGRWLMKQDRKDPSLKSIQGLVWREGYAAGELRGQVYPDVPKALQRWREQGKAIYIYSSGSVLAQKLLFQSTEYGDLTGLLDGYFDTEVGGKTDPKSYRTISVKIRCEPKQVLFISDAIKELEAAESSGIQTVLSTRAGNNTPESARFAVIHSFEEIFPG